MSDREHAFPNGTVSVKMHKRKRLTLVVDRDELSEILVERVEVLEHENRVLRRKITALTAPDHRSGHMHDCEHGFDRTLCYCDTPDACMCAPSEESGE